MKTVEDYEQIRKAFFVEGQSIRAIHRQLNVDRETIRKAIVQPAPQPYQLSQGRPAPVLGPYRKRIQELLDESEQLPRKQRYTAKTICRLIRAEGYQGCEGSVHNYVSRQRKDRKRKEAYLPLEFDAGQDGQVDWGEAGRAHGGQGNQSPVSQYAAELLEGPLCDGVPFPETRSLLRSHIQGFHFFGGVSGGSPTTI